MTTKKSFFSPNRFPSLTIVSSLIKASVSSTNCLSAVSRKFTVYVKKSRSRFPSVEFESNTSVTSIKYSCVYTSYFQPFALAIRISFSALLSLLLSTFSLHRRFFCFEKNIEGPDPKRDKRHGPCP